MKKNTALAQIIMCGCLLRRTPYSLEMKSFLQWNCFPLIDDTEETSPYPKNIKYLYNIYTMTAQRLRRWASIVYMLYKCLLGKATIPLFKLSVENMLNHNIKPALGQRVHKVFRLPGWDIGTHELLSLRWYKATQWIRLKSLKNWYFYFGFP